MSARLQQIRDQLVAFCNANPVVTSSSGPVDVSAALEMLSRTRACIAGDNSLEWSDIASNSSRRSAIRSICALTRELSLRPHCGGLRGLKVQFASVQLPGNGTILPLMESPIG